MAHERVRALLGLMLAWAMAAAAAPAAKDHLVCVVENEAALRNDGTLQMLEERQSPSVGQRFRVDRGSGALDGAQISNANAGKVTVLDPGGATRAFHAYWTSPKFVSMPIGFLHVMAQKDARAPFMLVESFAVLSGHCE